MGAWDSFVYCVKNAFNYQGRARRSEFWYFVLFGVLISFFLYIFSLVMTAFFGNIYLFSSFWLVQVISAALMILVGLSTLVRRLHDTNHSGWWVLIFFLYCVGSTTAMSFLNAQDYLDLKSTIYVSVLFLIGLVCLIFLIVLLVLPGTKGVNQYGSDPSLANEEK